MKFFGAVKRTYKKNKGKQNKTKKDWNKKRQDIHRDMFDLEEVVWSSETRTLFGFWVINRAKHLGFKMLFVLLES